jgi:stage III sporulation protein AE
VKKLVFFLLLLPMFSRICFAEDIEEVTARVTDIFQVESGLEEEERSVSGELQIDGSYDARGALGRLLERFRNDLRRELKQELRFGGILIAITLLCSLTTALCPGSKPPQYMELIACCAATLLLAGGLDGVIAQATDALGRLSAYSKTATPVFFTAVAASGGLVSASVKYAAVSFAMDVFMTISQRFILPLIHAYLAVSICAGLFENSMILTAGRVIKWCAITAMTVLTTAFVLYISLSGVISGSADAAAVKTTKTVISTTLPVVGGILSDSASAMLSAAAVIKNSAGVFSLIAVCAICVGPFAVLSVKMFVFRACAALSELACGGRYVKMLGNVGTAFGMLLGLVGSYGMMLFLSFMSGIRMAAV